MLEASYNYCLLYTSDAADEGLGVDLGGRRIIKKKEKKIAYGLTTPLLTLSSGAKMGKTERGAIWLNKKMLSPYDYWQFWRNTDDKDVINFLKLFTDIDLSLIHI